MFFILLLLSCPLIHAAVSAAPPLLQLSEDYPGEGQSSDQEKREGRVMVERPYLSLF
jgi:hypothetical protein